MLVKNILALLLAGLAVVTATNSSSSSDTAGSSSSSDTAGSSSSSNVPASSSSGSTPASSSSNVPASSSSGSTPASSSANPAPASSSSGSTPASSSANPGPASSSANPGPASSSANPAPASSSAKPGNMAKSSSDGAGMNKGNNNTGGGGGDKVQKPQSVKVVETSIEAKFKFAKGTKCSTVTSSNDMQTKFKKAACDAAGAAADKCMLTKLECNTGRLRQLVSHGNGTAGAVELKIKGTIKIELSGAVTVASVKSKMDNAVKAGASTKAFLDAVTTGLTVGGAAVTADATQTLVATAAVEKVVVITFTGSWTLMYYKDTTDCSGTNTLTTGNVQSKCNENLKLGSVDASFKVGSCNADAVTTVMHYSDKKCTAAGENAMGGGLKFSKGQCVQHSDGKGSFKFTCGVAAASTSDASTKSLVGVVFGLIMGFVTLM